MAPKPAAKKSAISKKPAAKSAKPAAKEKKPPSGYMLFCKSERPKVIAKSPSLTFGEVGKALGAAWGKLSDAEKAKYK